MKMGLIILRDARKGALLRMRSIVVGRILTQFDLVDDLMRKADAAEGENHLGRQLFVALETAGRNRVAHRFLDLALRGDADLLEKSAQAGVENIFVHKKLLDVYG